MYIPIESAHRPDLIEKHLLASRLAREGRRHRYAVHGISGHDVGSAPGKRCGIARAAWAESEIRFAVGRRGEDVK
jgi:hypothetical protein